MNSVGMAEFTREEVYEVAETSRKLMLTNLTGIDLSCNKDDPDAPSLAGVNLATAYLLRANLSGADLCNANFIKAYLYKANLRDADLQSADLTEADLTGADLTGADLRNADLRGTKYSFSTKWPEGFNPIAAGTVMICSCEHCGETIEVLATVCKHCRRDLPKLTIAFP